MKIQRQNLPSVAIIGNPNVGKSTLFNRLLGKRKAIVQRESGTTRDRVYEIASFGPRSFQIVDTGGLTFSKEKGIDSLVDNEVKKAIATSDVVIFVCDGKTGVTPRDVRLADFVRSYGKKILTVVNKIDNFENQDLCYGYYIFGFLGPIAVSAQHGFGINDLIDEILKLLPEVEPVRGEPIDFKLAIVGEMNAGKSTYLNKLLREERAIVSEIPGTTRDSIEEIVEYEGKRVMLVDTAGIRRRRKVKSAETFFSLQRARRSIKDCDVALLVFDALKGITKDVKIIARLLEDEGKAMVLVCNKWDLVKGMSQEEYLKGLRKYASFISSFPCVFISALKGSRIIRPIEKAIVINDKANSVFKTSRLNEILKAAVKKRRPSGNAKLKYIVQTDTKPPAFMIFGKGKKYLAADYYKYLTNLFVKELKLEGVLPKLEIREESK